MNVAQRELAQATFAKLAAMPEAAGAVFYEGPIAAGGGAGLDP